MKITTKLTTLNIVIEAQRLSGKYLFLIRCCTKTYTISIIYSLHIVVEGQCLNGNKINR